MMVMPDAVRAAGFVYRRAVAARPKRVVLFGIWIHFFPGLVANALVLLAILGGSIGGLPGLAGFFLAIVGVAICASMLYRVTRNYFAMQKTESHEAVERGGESASLRPSRPRPLTDAGFSSESSSYLSGIRDDLRYERE